MVSSLIYAEHVEEAGRKIFAEDTDTSIVDMGVENSGEFKSQLMTLGRGLGLDYPKQPGLWAIFLNLLEEQIHFRREQG